MQPTSTIRVKSSWGPVWPKHTWYSISLGQFKFQKKGQASLGSKKKPTATWEKISVRKRKSWCSCCTTWLCFLWVSLTYIQKKNLCLEYWLKNYGNDNNWSWSFLYLWVHLLVVLQSIVPDKCFPKMWAIVPKWTVAAIHWCGNSWENVRDITTVEVHSYGLGHQIPGMHWT